METKKVFVRIHFLHRLTLSIDFARIKFCEIVKIREICENFSSRKFEWKQLIIL